jgi:hypothetical protein
MLTLILLIFAFACFVIDAWRTKSLVAAGLAFWVGSLLVGHVA